MTVQCNVYVDFVRSYVVVVKSLSYYSRKLIVSSTQTKPLMTNIHEMCNKVRLLQHLRVSNHVISPIKRSFNYRYQYLTKIIRRPPENYYAEKRETAKQHDYLPAID